MGIEIKELGHVVLYVTNLEKVAAFYRDILGFPEVARKHAMVVFSSGRTHHELLLIDVGGKPEKRDIKPGLYHIGFKIGEGPGIIKQAYKELKKQNIPIIGVADHGITHSIYILDPDGNEIELYADVSDEWKKDPKSILTQKEQLKIKE